MKKNKTLVLSLLICLLPLLGVLATYSRLPESVVIHWGTDGNPDGWKPRWFLLLLPVILTALQLVCHHATAHGDPRTASAVHAMGGLTYWIIPSVSVFATTVTVCTALGVDVPVAMAAQLLVGLLLTIVGNYLPKCRQNSVIGIRMPWTLNDVDNWNFTHRIAGRVWMLGGIAMLTAAFFDATWLTIVILAVIVLATFGASLWHRLHHKGH